MDVAGTPRGDADESAGTPASPMGAAEPDDREPADLDAIERDLAGVEAALRRLDDGTYWTDEVTGAPIPDDVLDRDPVARRTS